MTSGILKRLDGVATWTGRAVSWMALLMMFTTVLVVVLRYAFSISFIALQESITYMHAMLFLLATACTLRSDGHVRVDIFYRNFTESSRAWVNAVGALVFLLPVCGFLIVFSWDFTLNSWRILESSSNANGIPAVFLLKTLIPLSAVLLALQGIAEVLRSLLILTGEQR